MKVADGYADMANSAQRALSTASVKKAVNQDAATVDKLLEGLDDFTEQLQLEQQTIPHKGQNINTWI